MAVPTERMLVPGKRLGKHARKIDPRTLELSTYDRGLPTPPAAVTLSGKVPEWPLYMNDELGDCAIAAPAHEIECWTANAGRERSLTMADVLKAYEEVSGYTPRDPKHPTHNATDNGCVMLDVLHHWRHQGIGKDKITAYVLVSHTEVLQLQQTVWLLGGVYLGLRLPETAQLQLDNKEPWTVVAMVGKGEPNSWGGHAVNIVDYDEHYATCVTWGLLQKMSWEFIQAYADEAYGVLSSDWMNASTHKSPHGFDMPLLLDDLSKFSKP
jgi:hypothetical protein